MIIRARSGSLTHEFACHSKACAPPPAGTGGSRSAGKGMGNAQGTMGKARYVRSDGTPVSKNYPGARPFQASTPYSGRPDSTYTAIAKQRAQKAAQAKLDRAMGIKPQEDSLSDIAKNRAKTGPARDFNNRVAREQGVYADRKVVNPISVTRVKVKASALTVSNGTIKHKGKDTGISIDKVPGGYKVTGATRKIKTQSAAKRWAATFLSNRIVVP